LRKIEFDKIVEAVAKLCEQACHELPEDVLAAIQSAAQDESDERAGGILDKLLTNADIARKDRVPLCQDTGLAVVFVTLGSQVIVADDLGRSITDAVNAGVELGYERGYLRKSVVAEPLRERKNTGTNTPAIVHIEIISGDVLKIQMIAKGGGCENKSLFRMFNPTAEASEIIDWVVDVVGQAGANACPPFVVGVGIGGDFEQCCYFSKKALLRRIEDSHPDKFYADIEARMLGRINALKVGPLGFGGDTTALAVKIEIGPCHIASLPVAVNIECHSHRHGSVEL